MPKFKVLLQRYVEEIAEVAIEAEDADEAREAALEVLTLEPDLPAPHWEPGDDMDRLGCYAVLDEDDAVIWER